MNAARRHSRRWLQDRDVLHLGVQVAEHFDYMVQAGPFKGMRYTRDAVLTRHATPALLGQYECQLYPYLMQLLDQHAKVIDIGHAEGYYAVGTARLGKDVTAFDASSHERRICSGVAAANEAPVDIRRWCTSRDLIDVASPSGALIISDIDGGELDLFSIAAIGALRHCDLIIEMHGANSEDNTPFVQRFKDTHRTQVIPCPEVSSVPPSLSFLGADAPRMAAEYRGFQEWLVAERI